VSIAFPFPELADDALIVDVGGGIGSTTLRLAERFPKLRFIIQDREPVCKLGEDV
jgi:16S rRNA A1518/A1519 N6-dimethyltransferase RsmA/KsgA/DIM1 with predicted DNA glycosylase/AP lyase activity